MVVEIQFSLPSTVESSLQASVGFNYPSTRKKISDSTLQGNHIYTPLRNCDTISPLAVLGGSFLPQYLPARPLSQTIISSQTPWGSGIYPGIAIASLCMEYHAMNIQD